MTTDNDPSKTVGESLRPVLLIITEMLSFDPLHEIKHLCCNSAKRAINLGFASQKLGFTAYLLNLALYGRGNKQPLMTHIRPCATATTSTWLFYQL
jgi:hypothetical protein